MFRLLAKKRMTDLWADTVSIKPSNAFTRPARVTVPIQTTPSPKADKPLPAFPQCKHLRGTTDGWLACLDVCRELQHSGSKQYLNGRFRKDSPVPLQCRIPSLDWNGTLWQPLPGIHEAEWMVEHSQLKPFCLWICDRSRKPADERKFLLEKLLITDVEESEIKVPIETSLLADLQRCCPYPIKRQYPVGKYRLDGFIERLRLAIQIDEHGHQSYDPEEEKEYNSVMRDHNIVCIRFNPHATKYPLFDLVRMMWEKTISPDYLAFRERLKL